VVAPAYLLDPALQLLLEERYAVAEVGDGLVFGFQQGVHARLQDARGLLDGNRAGGRCGRFAAILCRVVALRLCGCWGALGAGCWRLTLSTMNNPYGYLPARCAALLWRYALELAVPEHLPDAIGRELEGLCCLLDGVETFSLHVGSIHLEAPPREEKGAPTTACGASTNVQLTISPSEDGSISLCGGDYIQEACLEPIGISPITEMVPAPWFASLRTRASRGPWFFQTLVEKIGGRL